MLVPYERDRQSKVAGWRRPRVQTEIQIRSPSLEQNVLREQSRRDRLGYRAQPVTVLRRCGNGRDLVTRRLVRSLIRVGHQAVAALD